jgi:hypothetical protein
MDASGFGAIFQRCCRIASWMAGIIVSGILTTSRAKAYHSADSGGHLLAVSISL